MDAKRKRFVAAVVLFALWVGILAVLAAVSAKRPQERVTAAAPR